MIGLFDTRNMLAPLERILRPFSFLLDMFFSNEVVSAAETIEFDLVLGRRKMAPFVNPLSEGEEEDRQGSEHKVYKPAYVKPKRTSGAANWIKRLPGENPFSQVGVAERAAQLMVRDFAEMDTEILRREEWMAAQALATGKIPVVGKGLNFTVDFKRPGTHRLFTDKDGDGNGSGLRGTGWDDTTNGDPLKDADDASLKIVQTAGLNMDVIVMSQTAWELFIDHPKVIALLDKLKVNVGQLTGQPARGGAQLKIVINGYSVWVYNNWYLDDNGVEQSLWGGTNGDDVLFASTEARTARHYGAIYNDNVAGAAVRLWPSSWRENDPPKRMVMLESAPLPAIHEINGFVLASVTTEA